MRLSILVVLLAACSSAASPRQVENHVAPPPPAPPPLGACPRLTLFEGHPWQHLVFPQCPSEPFETDLPVCGAGECPRPCRVTETFPDIPPRTQDIHYDAAGHWVATIPTATSGSGDDSQLLASYDDSGHLVAVDDRTARGGSVRRLTYDHGRLVGAMGLLDEPVHLVYENNRLVRLDERAEPKRLEYDAHGRIVLFGAPGDDDEATKYTYDDAGYVVELVESYEERSKYSYDEQHRLVHVVSELHGGDATAADIRLDYDRQGRIVKITNDGMVDKVYRYTTSYEYCDR